MERNIILYTAVITAGVTIALLSGIMFFMHTVVFDTSENRIVAYYQNSVATLQSPHGYREQMDRGYTDYVLVDTRTHEDYVSGHITGAINIDSSQPVSEVLAAFRELDEMHEKPILIYCYSTSCMNGRKVGALLVEHDIYVRELTVGYNEWEFYPETWNYPDEWETLNIENYITRGDVPGTLERNEEKAIQGCGITGALSC